MLDFLHELEEGRVVRRMAIVGEFMTEDSNDLLLRVPSDGCKRVVAPLGLALQVETVYQHCLLLDSRIQVPIPTQAQSNDFTSVDIESKFLRVASWADFLQGPDMPLIFQHD